PPPAPAAAAPPPPAVSAAVPAASSTIEVWKRVKADLERRRPRLGALLANASVLEVDAGKLVLGFHDRPEVDAAERARADLEQALAAEMGGPVRLTVSQHAGAAPVMRAEAADEADAAAADRRRREQEARQHPIVQKAQDLFGAA